jgi:hypothetical protein
MTITEKSHPTKPTKRCPRCRTHRDPSWFSADYNRPDGRACWCKPCSRAAWRERKWGIGEEEFRQILQRQDGRCGICGERLEVDHAGSHRTTAGIRVDLADDGKVRGFLCPGCRTGLRGFGGDVERLRRAVGYLAASSEAPGQD